MVFSSALSSVVTFVKVRFHFKLHQHLTTVESKTSKTLMDVRGNLTYLPSARLEQIDLGIRLKQNNKQSLKEHFKRLMFRIVVQHNNKSARDKRERN